MKKNTITKKKGAIPKKLRVLAKLIAENEIDKIVFRSVEGFVYQYYINGTVCNINVYSKGKAVEVDEIGWELAEILRNEITNGYDGGISVVGKDIINILNPFGVNCFLDDVKSPLEANYQFEIGESSDS